MKTHKHNYVFKHPAKIAVCDKCDKPYKEKPNPNNRVRCQAEVRPPGRIWRHYRCGNWATYKTRGELTCTRHTYLEEGSEAEKLV